MSRSGYTDDYDDSDYPLGLYRGSVERAIRGKRGQSLLREMADAMDAMPVKELIAEEIVVDGAACALGVVAMKRGMDVSKLDPEDADTIANKFGIAPSMAREIVYMNDEACYRNETPSERWTRMRKWVAKQIVEATPAS